jgi:monoamine oxidase
MKGPQRDLRVTGPRPPKGFNSLGHPAVPPYQPANWPYGDGDRATLDQWNTLTLAQFHTQNGASDDWRRLYMSDNGTEVLDLAALAWLAQSALDFDWGTTYYLDGGLDQIAERLATSVKGDAASILQEHQATALVRTQSGIDVHYRDAAGTARTLTAEEVVCTVPFPVLRTKVDLSASGVAPDKMFWINILGMTPAARVALQVKDRFWRFEGIEGLKLVGTDTPMERVWHSTNTQAGTGGILQVYLQGQNALNAPALGTLPWARDGLSPVIFPLIADPQNGWNGKGVGKLWHLDEWAGGAWAAPRPNQMIQGFHIWGRAEGRIHFAGEHTSLYAGWMQGAIESGQRASAEVAAAI